MHFPFRSVKTATGSSCRSGIAAVGQTLCQTAYALNLISPFAKSTVPGARISTTFSQEHSVALRLMVKLDIYRKLPAVIEAS
jgi:hypothetical protein